MFGSGSYKVTEYIEFMKGRKFKGVNNNNKKNNINKTVVRLSLFFFNVLAEGKRPN